MPKQAKTVYVVCFNCWREFEHKRLFTVCPKCGARGRMKPMNEGTQSKQPTTHQHK